MTCPKCFQSKKNNLQALEACKGAKEVHRKPHFASLLFHQYMLVCSGLALCRRHLHPNKEWLLKSNPHRKAFKSELCWSYKLLSLVPGATTSEHVTPLTMNEKLMLFSYNLLHCLHNVHKR